MINPQSDAEDFEEIGEMLKDAILSMTQEDIDEYSKPFGVSIANDYRLVEERGPEGSLEGHIGVCLGYYFYEERFERLEELQKLTDINQIIERSLNPPFVNPLIYVPKAGAYIWGVESDWVRLDDLDDRMREVAQDWEAKVTGDKDKFLEAALAEVQELFYKH